MIKLSRTGITTLKRMYKSVLLKCLLINAGILLAAGSANAADVSLTSISGTLSDGTNNYTITGGTATATVDLSGYQTTISDLTDIRNNASAGAGAATTIASYGDIVSHNASEFQTTISDLTDIRNNASAGAGAATTIASYGDIVSHNASEFDLSGAAAAVQGGTTSTVKDVEDALADKQDALTADEKGGLGISVDSGKTYIWIRDNAITSGRLAENAVNSAKIADGTIIEDDLADAVKYNLLTHVATSDGLTVTAGEDASNPAKIELNLESGKGLQETANGLGIQLNNSADDKYNSGLQTTASGLSVKTTNGLETTDAGLGVKAKTNGGLTVGADGVEVNVGKTTQISGGYLEVKANSSQFVTDPMQGLTLKQYAVGENELANEAVTSAKIAANAVTFGKLATDAYDATGEAITNGTADKLATATGVKAAAQNATFTRADSGNVDLTANSTIRQAIIDLDTSKASLGHNNTFTGDNIFNGKTTVKGLELTDGETSPTTAAISVSKVDGVGAVVDIAANGVTSKEFRASTALTVDDGSDKERFVADANGITVGDGTNDTFKVESNTGNTTVGGTLGVKGDFAVNTDKFTVTAENGNVTTKGTVEINGATLTGGKDAEENPTLTSSAKVISSNGFEVTATTYLDENLLRVGDSSLSNTALTIGKASAITGAENSLDMGKNAVSNVKGLTLTDGETDPKTVALTVNTSGELSVDKIIDATQGLKFSSDEIAMTSVSRGEVAAAVNADNTAIVASATAVQATRAAINAENAGIFGAFYQIKDDAKLAYKNDVLVADGFVTGQDDFATSLTNYAANVRTATGGTFNAAGVWTATVSAASANKYEYNASATLMDAISQVAGNVGLADQLKATDKEGTDKDGVNGVTKDKTVNQNLTALNNTIGDLEGLNEFDDANSQGNAMTNGTGTAPTTVVEALNNIDLTLGSIHGLANKLGADYKGNLAEGTTVEQHLTALDAAIGDRSQFATGRYTATSESVADATMALDRGLGDLADEVRDFKKEYKSGMAQMAAMSALVPNARAHGNTQISVGTGAYQGQTAAAVGAFHWVNDNLLLNAGVSYGNSNNVAYRAGLTWSW